MEKSGSNRESGRISPRRTQLDFTWRRRFGYNRHDFGKWNESSHGSESGDLLCGDRPLDRTARACRCSDAQPGVGVGDARAAEPAGHRGTLRHGVRRLGGKAPSEHGDPGGASRRQDGLHQGLQRRSAAAHHDREPVEADHRRLPRHPGARQQALVHDAGARCAAAVLPALWHAGRSPPRERDGRAASGAPLGPCRQRRQRSDLRRREQARQQRKRIPRGRFRHAWRISDQAQAHSRSGQAAIPTATPATKC